MLVLLFAALAITAGAQQPTQGPRTWALVVGISKYQKLPGGQQLQFADRDAALFSEAIQKRGVSPQNVKLLTGVEATAGAIKSAVGNWLARSVSESDTVLIFFSGHGLFEREFGESYLLGYDSDPKDPYGTALSVSELGRALARRVRSGRVLVLADAVRRDFFDPESDPNSSQAFEQAFDQLTAGRSGLSAIIASGPGEFSREGQRWGGHGVFAKHLADVLFDGASKGGDLAILADELFELLKGRVAEDTSGKQHPWRSGTALAQAEVARAERQNAPATAPGTAPTARITPPNVVASSSKPADDHKPSDTRPQPEQKKNVAVGAPIASGPPPAETKPVAQSSLEQKPVEKLSVTERKPVQAAPPVSATKKESGSANARDKNSELPVAANRGKTELPPVMARAENAEAGAASGSGKTPAVSAPGGNEKLQAPLPPPGLPHRNHRSLAQLLLEPKQ